MELTARKMAKEAMNKTGSGMWKWTVSDLMGHGIETWTDWENFRDELEAMPEVEAVEFDDDGYFIGGIFVSFFREYCPNIEE